MKRQAVSYLLRLMIQRFLGLFLFLLGSGWMMGLREGVYFALYIIPALLSGLLMFRANPETLARRGDLSTNSPVWDKILLTLFWLLSYFVIYLAAGLQYSGEKVPDLLFWLGAVLQIFASVLSTWAVLVNTHLESTARIQSDREQTVCSDGPYRFLRHPSYTAILLWCVGTPLMLSCWSVVLIAVIVVVIIVIRTELEDRMLQKELHGYREYAEKTCWKLIPFVW